MVEMSIVYEGDLRCLARHGPSESEITTDAPVDNQGKGKSFSPTDLLATSLGVCMTTVMGIRARELAVDLRGARVRVAKHMVADPRRRVGRLEVDFDLPTGIDREHQEVLEDAARTCPVARSIHPDVEVDLRFRWGV